jgi:hypothetical protein
MNIASATDWSVSSPTVLSPSAGTGALNGEFYVSSIQFHAVAMTPQMIAGIGSPDTGPAPVGETVTPTPAPSISPVLTGGTLNLTWQGGGSYVLQETTDLGSGVWVDSSEPFIETNVNGNIQTTATIVPATGGPAKFYRITWRP